MLTACSAGQGQDPLAYDESRAGQLFSHGYQHITDVYIEEISIPNMAEAGMEGLTELDSAISVRHIGTVVDVTYGNRLVNRFPAPEAADAEGWGRLTASAVHSSRSISPVMEDLEPEELYEAVFDGIVARLDRFSRYSGRDAAQENRASRDGFGGIGVRIRVIDEGVKILSVMEKTPAEEAGLKAEDLITDINGASTLGLTQREVVRRLRGPIRTTVNLLVERDAAKEKLPFAVKRDLVVPQTVEYRIDENIGYLRVSNFNQGTAVSVREKIKLAQQDLGDALLGFILDLRGNPGGLLDQGVEVADLFLPGGRIVSTHGRHRESHQFFDAESGDLAAGLPVVVLLDGSSASATEIVAAALQDSHRAVLVGSNTFGKGTVQRVLPLPNDGELTLTWARFHAPSGYTINTMGVLPNLCTSGDIVGTQDVLNRLRQGEFPLQRYAIGHDPDESDPAQIAVLYGNCPRRDGEPEIDVEVAHVLLNSPSLYAQALGSALDSAALHQEAQFQGAAAACRTNPSDRSIPLGSC